MEKILQKYEDILPLYGHYALLSNGETLFISTTSPEESGLTPEEICCMSEEVIDITDSLWTVGFTMLPSDLHNSFINFGLDNIYNEELTEEDNYLLDILDFYFNKS